MVNASTTKATPTTDGKASSNALSGIRVIDLTQFEAGTSCTQGLAWLGADVVKIEPPGRGEQGRRTSAERPGIDAYYFMVLNCNKRSVTLNLKSEKGRAILRDLIATADVMVENFAPGTIERLGFDYETVARINPRLIFAQIKGFSPEGPYANYLAFDPVIQAAGGTSAITGEPNGPPMRPGGQIGDTGAGLHCMIGIISALFQREKTGRGQRVEVAMQENVINFIRVAFAAQMETGKPVMRTGSAMAVATAPRGFYKCKGDGPNDYVFIHTSRGGNHHFERLMRTVGRDDLIGDPRFETIQLRAKHHKEIDSIVSAWTIQHDKKEVMRLIGEAGTPIAAVFDTMELSTDQHLRDRGMFVTLQHPVRGEIVVPGWPVRMTETKVPVEAAPVLGANTEAVLCDLLDLTPADVASLHAEGVI